MYYGKIHSIVQHVKIYEIVLKKMCPLQLSPIDLMFKKMSIYQASLEQAVQLRTHELEQEKHKSENLLYSKSRKLFFKYLDYHF